MSNWAVRTLAGQLGHTAGHMVRAKLEREQAVDHGDDTSAIDREIEFHAEQKARYFEALEILREAGVDDPYVVDDIRGSVQYHLEKLGLTRK
jgi:hypothetical protein